LPLSPAPAGLLLFLHHYPVSVLKYDADVMSRIMLSVTFSLSDCAQK
jgi:hypothetical protein